MSRPSRLSVYVSGPMACFTRPEFGVERVSYPIITPPAAVGLLSAVFWKPEFDWVIDEIWVLNPIKWQGFTTNEVKSVASKTYIDVTQDRTQRHSLVLADVAYVIHCHQRLRQHAKPPIAKYQDQFRRRVERGAHFSQPYLGLQQFHADVRKWDKEQDQPNVGVTLPVGNMPLALNFTTDKNGEPDGNIDPEWFPAVINGGIMLVPEAGAKQ